jgi:hypothetical protein
MDYLEIVLRGYYNENNRKHLVDYFFSEFKKAEKETFCSSDLFFGGCMKIIDAFNENYQEQIYTLKSELNQYLVRNQEINKEFVKSLKERIEYEELNGNTNFRLKNGTNLQIFKKEITYIESAIINAENNLKSLPPQQTEMKSEQGTLTFTNNFDNIKPTEIYKHFEAGLVEKGYLTEQELNEYLKAAFELKTIPETLFKIKDAPNKAAIEAVFYRYYKNVAGKMHGKQKKYAALLGDYFESYKTTTVSSNFSKSVY